MGVLFSFCVLLGLSTQAAMPTNPVIDSKFLILPNGKDLRTISVSGVPLSLTHGTGNQMSASAMANYQKLRDLTKSQMNAPVQWVLMDLDQHRVIDQSLNPEQKVFGASVAKVFTGATLLDQKAGQISPAQLQTMAEMIVISSNTAWFSLQAQIGGGNDDRGRTLIQSFTERMGYANTRGFQGYLGSVHGNELNAQDLAQFMTDTYMNRYEGAETLWKLMHTGRTGAERAKKYIPKSLIVGGKTGTYDGQTVDPVSGASINVHVRHQIIVVQSAGHEYGLSILANTGSDESAALLAGGLLREYAGIQ